MEKCYRISSYLISIKLVGQDKYALLQGYTGAVDIVNKEIMLYLNGNRELLSMPESILNRMLDRGYITTKSQEEELLFVKRMANAFHERNKLLTKNFTLVVTYDCNFSCPYCFEKELQNEFSKRHIVISKQFVDKFYNSIEDLEKNENNRNKRIVLFGGEPLLKGNKEIVKYIVDEGRKHGYCFSATTNGYDLFDYRDLLKVGYIDSVQITIDGTRDIHNKRRIHASHGDSYDRILENIKMVLNQDVAVCVRVNVDEENYLEVFKLEKFFDDFGLYQFEKFTSYASFISGEINFSPKYECVSCSGNTKFSRKVFLSLFENPEMKMKYNVHLYNKLANAFLKRGKLYLSPSYCGAQGNSFVFDPFGYIYSCLEIIGDKEKAIGNYFNGIVWYPEKDMWFNRNIGNVEKCVKCKYAFLCGGGCLAKKMLSPVPIESYCDGFSLVLKFVVNNLCSRM